MGQPDNILLSIDHLSIYYGEIKALEDVSLQASQGEIVTVLGANGAGKSTLLMSISGMVKPRKGDILFDRKSIVGLSPDKVVASGISHVPEGRRIFKTLTVEENLLIGASFLNDRRNVKKELSKIYQYFPVLWDRKKQKGATLSGGEQQMLTIGRGLIGKPKLLLLDEPSLGLAPILVQQIFEIVGRINREENLTILLVEQNVELALKVSRFGHVLETGRISLSGTSEELYGHKDVRESYLGR